jgi:hypothetical protein
MMTRLILALSLSLLTLPALAAEKSESIPLSFVSPAEVIEILNEPGRNRAIWLEAFQADLATFRPSLIPSGVSAWAADSDRRALSVTGTEEGIAQLKQILRLLDIPRRRLKVVARAVQLTAPEREALRADPDIVLTDAVATLPATDKHKKLLEGRGSVVSAEVVVVNNGSAYVRIPQVEDRRARVVALTPRVNGDASVTLFLRGLPNPGVIEPVVSLRRTASGQGVLVLDSENRLWLLEATLLPEEAR